MAPRRRVVGSCLFLALLGNAIGSGVSLYGQDPKSGTSPEPFRLHLMDGSMVVGEPADGEIVVETEFGTLKIPVDRIRGFTPGLNSRPLLLEKLQSSLEHLGASEEDTRKQSHEHIVAMGPAVRNVLEELGDGGNAERKRHLREILKELATLDKQLREDADARASSPAWIREDMVLTSEFTVFGKISPAKLTIRGKFGELAVPLAKVAAADRGAEIKGVVTKLIAVSGEDLAQRGFKSSNILVRRGDRITVKADGKIRMTRWGSGEIFSTPDGGALFNWYVEDKIPGGTLIAKIGSSGKEFKVGGKHEFVAENSGPLLFALAVQEAFSKPGNYFSGHYNVRIKLVPK